MGNRRFKVDGVAWVRIDFNPIDCTAWPIVTAGNFVFLRQINAAPEDIVGCAAPVFKLRKQFAAAVIELSREIMNAVHAIGQSHTNVFLGRSALLSSHRSGATLRLSLGFTRPRSDDAGRCSLSCPRRMKERYFAV
jgi:hypothetical protein